MREGGKNERRERRGGKKVPDCRNGRKTHTQIEIPCSLINFGIFSPHKSINYDLGITCWTSALSWSCRQVSAKTVPTRSTLFRKAAVGRKMSSGCPAG